MPKGLEFRGGLLQGVRRRGSLGEGERGRGREEEEEEEGCGSCIDFARAQILDTIEIYGSKFFSGNGIQFFIRCVIYRSVATNLARPVQMTYILISQ